MATGSVSPKPKQYDPDSNVYIAGLPRDYNKEKLYNLFCAYGEILRYKFVSPKDDTKCPYGFVQFSHPQCAQNAIKALNGHVLNAFNESIEVSIAAVGRKTSPSDEPTNLYIENMPCWWNNEQLTKTFGRFGSIVQSKLTVNNVAFVRYETHEQALNAINHLHREQIEPDNKRLTVRFATCQHKKTHSNPQQIDDINGDKQQQQHQQQEKERMNMNTNKNIKTLNKNENNLYIKNLPSSYNQLSLERLFSKYGHISSATIINDSIGVAFVRYKYSEDARRAIKQLNGTKPALFEKEIVVKLAHSDIDQQQNISKQQNILYQQTIFNQQQQQQIWPWSTGNLYAINLYGNMTSSAHVQFMQNNSVSHGQPESVVTSRFSSKDGIDDVAEQDSIKKQELDHMLVHGYIREQQILLGVTFESYMFDIIKSYFIEYMESRENDKAFDDACFDELLDRINTLDDRLEILQNNIHGITTNINNLLYDAEQKRMNEMNTMQKQFHGVISKLYHQMNNQLLSMTNMLQQTQTKESLRITMLEKQVYSLNEEKIKQNDDISKMQQKLNALLRNDKLTQNEKIKIWLTENVRLSQYYDILINNGYDDMESIRDMTETDLIQIGIDKIGHRKKILKYAQQVLIQNSINRNKLFALNAEHYINAAMNNSINSPINSSMDNDENSNCSSSTAIPWTCWNCRCYNIATSIQCTLCGHTNQQ